ncbi:hypothetical protein QDD76_004963 [Burkholderia cepacia]|jgi:hypothetical protein|uniref:Plasmid stability protein StbB n=1 Tax=Burkholderia contaminans TaxID=488447 RepID=A0ABD7YH10_9BURK|nr:MULTISPECIES: StbB family protein [Burkholderia]EKS9798970.1 hypothetical protein [Burkholderia cepacia]EKS9805924.1 hypothetical protein [Burkholderia cepacia]EKS9813472.1 hypothetical protein [Burkholderia cepacia]EKS9820311.1 hypothetical protein [Burkholderia cepacia]EKS9828176.1 hypothetical protein [Burkholderia cepacia]
MNISIALVNCSGNVGKTTLTRELFAPRLPGMPVRQIESINADEADLAHRGGDVQVMIAGQFDELHEELMQGRAFLVDIGASNVEEYLRRLDEASGLQEDYGFFVVPAVPDRKQLQDTLKTIDLLTDLGVEPERIRVVLNQVVVERNETVEVSVGRAFAPLLELHRRGGHFMLDTSAVVPKSDVFSLAAELGTTLHALCRDETDYRAAIAAATDSGERVRLSRRRILQSKARSISPKLDAVFEAVMRETVA